MKYYIADTHFGHRSVLTFDNRPFSVGGMERVLQRSPAYLWTNPQQAG